MQPRQVAHYIHISFLRLYVEEKLGTKYVEKTAIPFEVSYQESGPATPVFFVLSPGVDPLKDVEALGKKLGFATDNQNFHNVSLGQGQEIVAENALDLASKDGHWVILQVVWGKMFSIVKEICCQEWCSAGRWGKF